MKTEIKVLNIDKERRSLINKKVLQIIRMPQQKKILMNNKKFKMLNKRLKIEKQRKNHQLKNNKEMKLISQVLLERIWNKDHDKID